MKYKVFLFFVFNLSICCALAEIRQTLQSLIKERKTHHTIKEIEVRHRFFHPSTGKGG
jgi:hypothetical protein